MARAETKAMNVITDKTILGVVGGLGPLASAEFLKTIYENCPVEHEQQSPTVIVYSDPTFPDRTDAFLAGNSAPLLAQLIDTIERLLEAGATEVVLCCMTMHYLLPALPFHLRERVVSLLDVVFANLFQHPKKRLLICSTGTMKLELFQRHADWPRAASHVILPHEGDQHAIHRDLIYPIKRNPKLDTLFPLLESLLEKYEVDSYIAGCSEVHLLAKQFVSGRDVGKHYDCIDPLAIIAQQLSAQSLGASTLNTTDREQHAAIITGR